MGTYSSCTVYCDEEKRRDAQLSDPYSYNCSKEWIIMPDSPQVAIHHCINMCKICGGLPPKCDAGNSTILTCAEQGLSRGTALGLFVGLPVGIELFLALLLFYCFERRRRRILQIPNNYFQHRQQQDRSHNFERTVTATDELNDDDNYNRPNEPHDNDQVRNYRKLDKKILLGAVAVFVIVLVFILAISLAEYPKLTKYADDPDAAEKFANKKVRN